MKRYVDEYIADFLRKTDLCPGVDISIDFAGEYQSEDISASVFWHKPSLNTSYYPIVQIDYGRKTIFHREGGENPQYWKTTLEEAASFVSNFSFDAYPVVYN